jgi:hypothetical protein
MRVLIIGDKNHVFIYNLVKWIKKTNPKVDSIDVFHRNKKRQKTDALYRNIYSYESSIGSLPITRRFYREKSKNRYFLNKFIKIQENFDLTHIHYFEDRLVKNAKFIADNLTGRLIVSIWGSDFYRRNSEDRDKMLPILKRAEVITFENPEMMEEFRSYYLKHHDIVFKQLSINRFGLAPLDDLKNLKLTREECKSELNLPIESITITVGYNAFRGQQHDEIIKSFKAVADKLDARVILLFPLTYGDQVYGDHLNSKLQGLGLPYKVFSSFMTNREVALLRKASDYFINLQITDALSGSMLEHLYANSIVVTGSWLPYGVLDKLGIKIHKINDVSQVGEIMIKLIEDKTHNFDNTNGDKIFEFSYWGNCIKSWNELYG